MNHVKNIVLTLSIITAAISVLLLLNITAPNPTGRRYSSESPRMVPPSQAIGFDGERILSRDLGLPRNDAPDQLQCICDTTYVPSLTECRTCMVSVRLANSSYRRPDFITPRFIVESKNAQDLFYDTRDLIQITDYAMGARAMKVPLYVFTRVNTNVDPEFIRIVGTTGGAVIPYFTTPDYVDPVDQLARTTLIGSFVVGVLALLPGMIIRARPARIRVKPTPRTPKDPFNRTIDSVEDAQDFGKRSSDHLKDQL